jgi:hypothetical protein
MRRGLTGDDKENRNATADRRACVVVRAVLALAVPSGSIAVSMEAFNGYNARRSVRMAVVVTTVPAPGLFSSLPKTCIMGIYAERGV